MYELKNLELLWKEEVIDKYIPPHEDSIKCILIQDENHAFIYFQDSNEFFGDQNGECYLYQDGKKVITLEQNNYKSSCNYFFLTYRGEKVILFNPEHSILSLINMSGEEVARHQFMDLFVRKVHMLTPDILVAHGWVWSPIPATELIVIDQFDRTIPYAPLSYDIGEEIPERQECKHCNNFLTRYQDDSVRKELDMDIPSFIFHCIDEDRKKRKLEKIEKINRINDNMYKNNNIIKALFNREQHPYITYSGDDCSDLFNTQQLTFISCVGGESGNKYTESFTEMVEERKDVDLFTLIFLPVLSFYNFKPHEIPWKEIRHHYIITFDKVEMVIKNVLCAKFFNEDDTPSRDTEPYEITFKLL